MLINRIFDSCFLTVKLPSSLILTLFTIVCACSVTLREFELKVGRYGRWFYINLLII
jgi:hypothetical protein